MASRRMSDAELSSWLRLLPDEWRLRPMQRRGLELMARGEDLLVVDRTGGGKSLLFQLPAIADWVVEVERGDELPSVTLLVVPFVSLGEHQAAAFDALIKKLRDARRLPEAAPATTPAASQGGETASAWPTALPCGSCEGCRGTLAPNLHANLPMVGDARCCWSCKVAAPGRPAEWCDWCQAHPKSRAVSSTRAVRGLKACVLRSRLLAPHASGEEGGSSATPSTTAPMARTRSAALVSPAPAKSSAAETETAEEEASEPTCLSDLHRRSPERRIAEDASIALVIVTASALDAEGRRGRLLREALTLRTLRRRVMDESHTVDAEQMASYAPSVGRVGICWEIGDSAATVASGVQRRPPRLALTGTLPPVATPRVLRRLRMSEATTSVLRGSIDRPDVTYYRIPLTRADGESLIDLGVRTLALIRNAAPRWATEGRTMIFTSFTSTARRLAAALCKPPCTEPAWCYCSRSMDPAEREQNRRAWENSPRGIIVCTGALGTGTSTPGVRLVIGYDFPADVIELAQHVGRAAREDGESGVAALCMTGQFASERLALLAPTDRAGVANFVRVLGVLFTTGCFRAALLREFGEVGEGCAGCDHCCRCGYCASAGALLPELAFHCFEGREAAILLMEHVRALDETPSLPALLRSAPLGAAAPFASRVGHEMLCLALIPRGGLVVENAPHPHLERGSVPRVTMCERVLHEMRSGGKPFPVLLPADAFAGNAVSGRVKGAEELEDAADRQEVSSLIAAATESLELAQSVLRGSARRVNPEDDVARRLRLGAELGRDAKRRGVGEVVAPPSAEVRDFVNRHRLSAAASSELARMLEAASLREE
ncbi:hypothetical protein EMIHUDRAFT_226957 [Emiliania huxleyi CCMP1516]|uniref:DNA 3'-5' helicase n=2 Tax=Emiliania huxleyi TaxID=2903 RepID=A0A0D3KJZ9_EMIH1|nr:hypothetical protein EMIHUDRAFT_226957 [Emiliania huxleyi CCMP1516]EOD36084.1 hypothetical protein EMIHUDRAFT_226957 [Emiliania huxleyi CCMP1516]|eukprot:XP_005788513.1 hypothetical protein EMIHUDRAFT_226957 [Emiliania huxleyi CCMP1516]